jgi:hypothetical protein
MSQAEELVTLFRPVGQKELDLVTSSDCSKGAVNPMTFDPRLQQHIDGHPYIPELIERKQTGSEKQRLTEVDLEFHQIEYERLRGELQHSFESSCLPETPRGAEALHALLVRIRLGGVSGGTS